MFICYLFRSCALETGAELAARPTHGCPEHPHGLNSWNCQGVGALRRTCRTHSRACDKALMAMPLLAGGRVHVRASVASGELGTVAAGRIQTRLGDFGLPIHTSAFAAILAYQMQGMMIALSPRISVRRAHVYFCYSQLR